MKILRLATLAQDDMPLVLWLTDLQTAIYRPRNDTGHGSCVSITGQGGAKLTAAWCSAQRIQIKQLPVAIALLLFRRKQQFSDV